MKESGFGRLNGRDGLRALTHPRALLEDRLPLPIANKLFPVKQAAYATTRATIEVMYGPGLGRRLRGVRDMVKALRG
jgi:hypothetical protein